MNGVDLIPEQREEKKIVYAPKIVQRETPQSINGLLGAFAVVLFIGILATYFVEEIPDVVINLREISAQALWVFVGGFAIGEIFKKIAVNRARNTAEYKTARSEAQAAVKKNADEKKTPRAKDYCEDCVQTVYATDKARILGDAGIDLREYEEKYVSLAKREILQRYPNCGLSKQQFKAIQRANAVKKMSYNPDFLRTLERTSRRVAPSELHDAQRRNLTNTISSAFLGMVGSIFAVSFVKNLIFDFSPEVIFDAVVKIIVILIMIAVKTQFGWSLVMDTEVSRYKLQKAEAERFSAWCDDNKE